jgi:hypothetical protein
MQTTGRTIHMYSANQRKKVSEKIETEEKTLGWG